MLDGRIASPPVSWSESIFRWFLSESRCGDFLGDFASTHQDERALRKGRIYEKRRARQCQSEIDVM